MATTYDKASLVMIPSGYKDDKLYSIKPTDGSGDFTFSRDGAGASPATRVNASGFIEKGRTNEVLQSNTFDTTWLNAASTETGGQAGYDGTNDAWLLEKTGATGHIYQPLSSSGVLTLSVYAKAGSRDWMRVIATGGSSTPSTWFDLANGVVGTADLFTIDSNIESVGGGWYRCSITFEVGSINGVRFYPAEGNNDISGTSGNIYIQDAQLEQGLVATDYIETTTTAVSAGLLGDMPRLDYSGGATCPSLLLEPSRTNKYLFSEYYGSGALDIYATGTHTYSVTNNYGISPEGVQNAIRFVADVTSANDRVVLRDGVSCGGGNHTLTFYAKSNTTETYTMAMHFDGSGKKQIEVTPEWQRFEYAESANTTCNAGIECRNASGYSSSVDVLVYGFQLEENLYPTSYIPTYGSASTRAQDQSVTASPSTSLFGQTEGTIFIEFEVNAITSGAYSRIMNLKNSGGSNQIYFQQNDSRLTAVVFNGSNQFSGGLSSGSLVVGQTYKAALAYKNADYALYVDGTQIATGSASGLGTLAVDRVDYTTGIGNIVLGNECKQSLVFNTRLTNAELAALTA